MTPEQSFKLLTRNLRTRRYENLSFQKIKSNVVTREERASDRVRSKSDGSKGGEFNR